MAKYYLDDKRRKVFDNICKGDYILFKKGTIRKVIEVKIREAYHRAEKPSNCIVFYTHNAGSSKNSKTSTYVFTDLIHKISAIIKPNYNTNNRY